MDRNRFLYKRRKRLGGPGWNQFSGPRFCLPTPPLQPWWTGRIPWSAGKDWQEGRSSSPGARGKRKIIPSPKYSRANPSAETFCVNYTPPPPCAPSHPRLRTSQQSLNCVAMVTARASWAASSCRNRDNARAKAAAAAVFFLAKQAIRRHPTVCFGSTVRRRVSGRPFSGGDGQPRRRRRTCNDVTTNSTPTYSPLASSTHVLRGCPWRARERARALVYTYIISMLCIIIIIITCLYYYFLLNWT